MNWLTTLSTRTCVAGLFASLGVLKEHVEDLGPRGRRRAPDTSVSPRSERPSSRGAIKCSDVGGPAAACPGHGRLAEAVGAMGQHWQRTVGWLYILIPPFRTPATSAGRQGVVSLGRASRGGSHFV